MNPHSAALSAEAAMRLAIEEGKKGAGFVSPNPLVGCAILDADRRLLAVGHHARVGEAHAEANALARLADEMQLADVERLADEKRLVGAHVYVTLEPCAHEGRTPSCAKALAKLPIASVTYGVEDPNPLVSGQGARILREAGKRVELSAHLRDECEELAEIFLLNMRRQRPFVALKLATSLDGKVALHDGPSRWITGEPARARVQTLRAHYDAVVIGAGTFTRDDPRLNSRDPAFVGRPNRVVLLDPDGKSYPRLKTSALLSVRPPEEVFVVTGPGTGAPPVGRQLRVTDFDRDFDLDDLLAQLRSEGIHSLFLEGGPRTATAFLKRGLVDRLYLFMAPKILGEGMDWTAGLRLNKLDEAPRLSRTRVGTLGEDILLTGRIGTP